jgi:drug/metabolite transporter (DMT)-like permease
MLLSWPRAGAPPQSALPVVQGLLSAAFFAMSSVAFRGAIESLAGASYVTAATTTLVAGLLVQTVLMLGFTAWHDRRTLVLVAAAWRPALLAGFLGALASQFWFLAFALESAARVRTLGVVEIVFAQIVSQRLFREGLTRRGIIGLVLIAIAMIAVVQT